MDDLRTRLNTLEQQTAALTHHAHRVTRQLRWWQGLAGGLLMLAVLTWALPMGTAQEDIHRDWRDLPARVAVLEQKLQHLTSKTDAEGHAEVVIAGANVRIVNGRGRTDCTDEDSAPMPNCPNGLGNLIVGYNEPRATGNVRTGSHNVVVGRQQNFSSVGGLVVGDLNEISGAFAAVSGGTGGKASGVSASVCGGFNNTASGPLSAVSGGVNNTADGASSSVSGGVNNIAEVEASSVSGGVDNTAGARGSSVSGGKMNRTLIQAGVEFEASSISGGANNLARGIATSISGGFANHTAGGQFGDYSSVAGGVGNFADGDFSAVSGGSENLVVL